MRGYMSRKLNVNDHMRILILEDNHWRNHWFIENFKGHALTMCDSVQTALKWVTKNEFDILFLDHDLSDAHYEAALNGQSITEGTGYEVAKVIPETINKDKPVIIHSMNPVGGKRMKLVIGNNAVQIPFGYFDKNILQEIYFMLNIKEH